MIQTQVCNCYPQLSLGRYFYPGKHMTHEKWILEKDYISLKKKKSSCIWKQSYREKHKERGGGGNKGREKERERDRIFHLLIYSLMTSMAGTFCFPIIQAAFGEQWVKSPLGPLLFHIRVPVWVQVNLLPIQLPVYVAWVRTQDSSFQAPTIYVGDLDAVSGSWF